MDGSTFFVLLNSSEPRTEVVPDTNIGHLTMAITIKADELLDTVNKLCGTNYDNEKQKGKVITIANDGSVTIGAKKVPNRKLLVD